MKINVKIANQSFEVEIDDLQSRPILAKVDGQTFEVWPEEATAPAAAAATSAAASAPAARPAPASAPAPRAAAPVMEPANASNALLSPLPGTVVAIAVREGDEVKTGQELLTLEAMKMKNAIRAGRDGKIAAIRVNVGDQVRHNQVLLEYAS